MGGQAELHGGEVSGNGDYLLIGLQNQSKLTLDSVDVTATAGTYSGYMPNAQSIYVQQGSHLIIENGSNLQLGANQINLSQGATLDMSDSTVTTASRKSHHICWREYGQYYRFQRNERLCRRSHEQWLWFGDSGVQRLDANAYGHHRNI
jgi:hypothetical protein